MHDYGTHAKACLYDYEQIQAAGAPDHDAIFELPVLGPTAFLYGPAAEPPTGFEGVCVHPDRLAARARDLLAASWHQVLALTRRAVLLETLGPEEVAAALAEPAPARAAFDPAAAARGALIAGYPRARSRELRARN